MSNNLSYVSDLLFSNFYILSMLAYAGGCALCFIYRCLSSKLLLVAAGFAGIFVSEAIVTLSFSASSRHPDLMYVGLIVATVIKILSSFLLVFGLGRALVDIRRKLALSLEPTHGRS